MRPDLSCRNWTGARPRRWGLALILTMVSLAYLLPTVFFNVLFCWILFALLANGLFKASMLVAGRTARQVQKPLARPKVFPKMSILVPLLREEDIVDRLIKRMARLVYPKELLEICLVYEESDEATKNHLAKCRLPYWMKTVLSR